MENENLFECVLCGRFSDDGDLINHVCLDCIEKAYLERCSDFFVNRGDLNEAD